MANENKPFVQMNQIEFARAWDDIMEEDEGDMLKEARESVKLLPIVVAAAVLTLSDGTQKIAYYVPEYGDGDGLNMVADFIRRVRRLKLLREGEEISRALIECSPASARISRKPLRSNSKKKTGSGETLVAGWVPPPSASVTKELREQLRLARRILADIKSVDDILDVPLDVTEVGRLAEITCRVVPAMLGERS